MCVEELAAVVAADPSRMELSHRPIHIPTKKDHNCRYPPFQAQRNNLSSIASPRFPSISKNSQNAGKLDLEAAAQFVREDQNPGPQMVRLPGLAARPERPQLAAVRHCLEFGSVSGTTGRSRQRSEFLTQAWGRRHQSVGPVEKVQFGRCAPA
jgi:hypothetical protein